MNRKFVAAIAVVMLATLSGCATISVTADVGDADTLDRYEMNISTSTTVYGLLNEGAKEDGYDDLEDQIQDEQDLPEENFEYNEEIDGNDAKISIELTDVPTSEMDAISIEEEDGLLVYEDDTFVNESAQAGDTSETGEEMMSGLVLEYSLNMPGEITSSNADEVDGNTATWTRTGSEAFSNTSVRATSETPIVGSVPGFGVPVALVAILSLIVYGRVHSKIAK